jgi:nicotinamidase-related amidase
MRSAIVVVDMLNSYDHEDSERLMASVREALPAMLELLARGRKQDVPIVYVNDNYGDWSACRSELVEHALQGRAPDLVEPIAPSPDVGFVVKARHSIFYQTQLEYLLRQEEIERVVLVGQVTEQCILYSALDAYVRHFAVAVPRDAVAHIHADLADAALRMMGRNMRADVCAAAEYEL